MEKYIVLICLLFLSCNNKNVSAETDKISTTADTLTFSSSGFNSRNSLKFIANQHFVAEASWASCFGGGGTQKVFGTYDTIDGKTILKPKTVEYTEHPREESDSIITKKFDYNPAALRIDILTEYFLIEWQQNKYLLSEEVYPIIPEYENDFFHFARYFNSESLQFRMYGFLRLEDVNICDTIKTNFDYNQIPEKWRKYFLPTPLTAQIKNIKKYKDIKDEYSDGSLWIVELDKGSNDNVYKGLYFRNSKTYITIEIDSTAQTKSYGTIYLSKGEIPSDQNLLNCEVSTRWN